MIAAYGQEEERPQQVRSRDRMDQHEQRMRIEHQFAEIQQHYLRAILRHRVTDRMLHEAIGRNDPDRRHVDASKNQHGRHRPEPPRNLVTVENPDACKRTLEKERHHRLDRQRRAEDIAHELRVLRPVRSELNLHRDARDNACHKIDREQISPEVRLPAVDLPTRPQVKNLKQGHEEDQADGQWHDQEVECNREGELDAAEQQDEFIHLQFPERGTGKPAVFLHSGLAK